MGFYYINTSCPANGPIAFYLAGDWILKQLYFLSMAGLVYFNWMLEYFSNHLYPHCQAVGLDADAGQTYFPLRIQGLQGPLS